MPPSLDLPTFVARWRAATLTERAAAQSHFIDLCRLLGQPTPAEADPAGESYAFERGAKKLAGGDGWADVWMRGHFAWEYKGKHKDLKAAYRQLQQYREDLENPPLLVVCDLDRVEVHTNFTGTVKQVYAFDLADLASPAPTPASARPPLEVLRLTFTDPWRLQPGRTPEQATEQAAREFARLADGLRGRGADPEAAARFLMRLLFCLFAEDIGLLPAGLFTRMVGQMRRDPPAFRAGLAHLFGAMRTGGWFGPDAIARFNGGLFDDEAVLELGTDDLGILGNAARLDWASVEPAVFGTLFERSLDPAKRSQLGAHYTSRADILLIVEPVLLAPLRWRWAAVKERAAALVATWEANWVRADMTPGQRATARGRQTTAQNELRALLGGFLDELAGVRILDPACGSGNFLYVALKRLLDLEKEVIAFATAEARLSGFAPRVSPAQLHGIEVNPYAHELAGVVIWIGYIQWLHDNGFGIPSDPVLKPLEAIRRMDAILAHDEAGRPTEPEWPAADVIIGNPPFLGDKKMRGELGDAYVDDLRRLYAERVPGSADLVCYWFEKARHMIELRQTKRAGLLATQAIRGGSNRKVLERTKHSGNIFWAQSDRNWILDGASVHVSMVGLDDGSEKHYELDGVAVSTINSDLTSTLDLTTADNLKENRNLAFQGPVIVGPFDVDPKTASDLMMQPNPHNRPNSEVLFPVVNAADLTGRRRGWFVIDFGQRDIEDASLYEAPFEYVRRHVKPLREQNRDRQRRTYWWRHGRSGADLRLALTGKQRQIASPRVSKYRLFSWLTNDTIVTDAVVAIARDDDYFFGVLHSRVHELWARRMGTQLREAESGFRYTPTTCFETFPFPWPPGREPAGDPRVEAVAAAARDLVAKRDAWLNPPGAGEAELKRRTLTNLYNERPTWLDLGHRGLDRATLAAYGWPDDLTDDELLTRLLALNGERATAAGGFNRRHPWPVSVISL